MCCSRNKLNIGEILAALFLVIVAVYVTLSIMDDIADFTDHSICVEYGYLDAFKIGGQTYCFRSKDNIVRIEEVLLWP